MGTHSPLQKPLFKRSKQNHTITKQTPKSLSQQLRADLKTQRRALSPQQQSAASKAVIRNLQRHRAFHRSQHIGSYWPFGGEIDLTQLRPNASQKLYYPVLREAVRPWEGKGLLFGQATEKMVNNRYGIPEPRGGTHFTVRELQYLLVPLVGFDRQGNRIGMGGGYYDRALARAPRHKPIFFMGVGYSWQEIPTIENQPWDIPLDGVVTDRDLMIF